jgi:sigma-B regulation protein RsbU (phosphoserine phosphatase)
VATVHLDDGDALLLYTDGVVEVTDARDQEFGADRVMRVLGDEAWRPALGIIDALVAATRAHARGGHYGDDFTLVVVKRRTPDN